MKNMCKVCRWHHQLNGDWVCGRATSENYGCITEWFETCDAYMSMESIDKVFIRNKNDEPKHNENTIKWTGPNGLARRGIFGSMKEQRR